MPSDILRGGNATTDAIVMIHCMVNPVYIQCIHWSTLGIPLGQLLNFELSGCHLAPFPSKVFIWSVKQVPVSGKPVATSGRPGQSQIGTDKILI